MSTVANVVLPIISILLLILFIVWAIWYYFSNGTTNNVNTNNSTGLCPAGQCATNIFSGVKTCPAASTDSVTYNILNQVCNSPNNCDNPLTPYALQPDFGTTTDGVCAQPQCQCLQQPQCPAYITSYFIAENGKPYYPLDVSRVSFQQSTSYVNQARQIVNSPPFSLPYNSINYCSLPIQWLPRTYPRDCVTGTLALLAPNPSQVTLSNVVNFPFGCVTGSPCGTGTAVWDTQNQKLVCITLCPNGQPRWDENSQTVTCQSLDS